MNDYISREDAIYAIKKAGGCIGIHDCFETRCGTCQINFALSAVNDLPAADVVEVIRCKDCKYFNLNKWGKVNDIPLIVAHEICDFWGEGCKVNKNGYCSFAERREASEKEDDNGKL